MKSWDDKFWERVNKTDGCWEWTGWLNDDGYGKFRRREDGSLRARFCHRLSWEIHFGPIPLGMQVCHHCDNRKCVRPDHLWLGTHQANMRDRDRKGRCQKYNAAKTHCINGHEYTPENTRRTARGSRWCVRCSRERNKARAA